jgi:hypothetical protein
MADRVFYVRALRANNIENLATGIQVIIPDGLDYYEARRFVIGRVVDQIVSYFADECVSACGVERLR